MIKVDDGPLFRVKGLVNRFGDQVVHNGISFDIDEGDVLTIIGRNGQGKTILLESLHARNSPFGGRILFEGKDIARFNANDHELFCRRTGYVFQGGALLTTDLEDLTPADAIYNVSCSLILGNGASRVGVEELAIESLRRAGVRPIDFYREVDKLSGGTQRRVAIAREIAWNPEIFFYDEPTAMLDPSSIAEMAGLIVDLSEDKVNGSKRTSIIVTNDRDLPRMLPGRVGLLYQGHLYLYDSFDLCVGDRENSAVRDYFNNGEE